MPRGAEKGGCGVRVWTAGGICSRWLRAPLRRARFGCAAPCEEGGRRFLLRQRGGRGRHAACAAQHRGAARAAPAPERGCGRGRVRAGACRGGRGGGFLAFRSRGDPGSGGRARHRGRGGNRQGDGEGGRPAGSGAGSPARRRVDQRGGCRRFERGLCRCVLQGHVWRGSRLCGEISGEDFERGGARAMGGVCCGRRDHLREVRLVGRGHPDAFPQRGSHRARRVRRSPVRPQRGRLRGLRSCRQDHAGKGGRTGSGSGLCGFAVGVVGVCRRVFGVGFGLGRRRRGIRLGRFG